MNINDTVEFDESKNLSEQTTKFQTWYNENVNTLISDTLVPDLLDQWNRPMSYTVKVGGFVVTIYPLYKIHEQSDWGCRDFQITLKTV